MELLDLQPPLDSGSLVKQLRTRMEISQDALARRIGSTVKSVSRWESGGKIAAKYLTELARLARQYRGPDNIAGQFDRLRSEELARALSDNRSTRRIPDWELQSITDEVREILRDLDTVRETPETLEDLDTVRQIPDIRKLKLRLRAIEERLSLWTRTRWTTLISPDDDSE